MTPAPDLPPLAVALVHLRASLLGVVDAIEDIERAFGASLPVAAPRPALTAEDIQTAAAGYFDVTVDDLTSISRRPEVVEARHVGMYLCRILLGYSYPRIGRCFAMDHTTASLAVRQLPSNSGLMAVAEVLAKHLKGE